MERGGGVENTRPPPLPVTRRYRMSLPAALAGGGGRGWKTRAPAAPGRLAINF